MKYAIGSRRLCGLDGARLAHGHRATITALSPSDREFTLFLEHIATMMPAHGQPAMAAPPRQSPNLASVVLAISVGNVNLCLGADMELHSDQRRGWNAVLSEAAISSVGAASMVKVAHHGSANGHHAPYWNTYVAPQPHCVVTPFNRSSKLPRETDIDRLAALGTLYITGLRNLPKPVPRDGAVERSLWESGIVLRDLQEPIGMVRLRRAVGAGGNWQADIFPPAHRARGRPLAGIA